MTPAAQLESCSWPLARLGECLALLARFGGLSPCGLATGPAPPEAENNGQDLSRWIAATAHSLGIESEPAEAPYGEIGQLLRASGPALFRLPGNGAPRFLALVRGGRRSLSLAGTDLCMHRFRPEIVRTALCREIEAPGGSELDRLLDSAGVPKPRQAKARLAILRQQLSGERVRNCWLLRLAPGESFSRQARRARLPGRLAGLVLAHTFQYLLWLLSWWLIGQAALQGRFDRGWLTAWALLLFCLVPLRWLVTWTQGLLAIGAGGILKQRLLVGALRLEPEEIRHQGAGQLLGRVMESEAVESLALSGGFLALVAGIELLIAAFVLAAGAGGWFQSLLLAVWVALTLGLGWSYYRRRVGWTEDRLAMTNDLVERMVGHRTRLAQEARPRWHQGEDEALDRYLSFSASMDRRGALLLALPPRGWLALALLALAPGFAFAGDNPAALAVALGGMLLAYRAVQKLTAGLSHLVGAAIAWQQIRLLFHAAARSEPRRSGDTPLGQPVESKPPAPQDAPASEDPINGRTVLEAHDLLFRYPGRADPVLRGCSLRISRGERLLLEGPSGGGKSTLAAVLAGLRRPESGLLLLRGLDRQTLGGEAWRRRVVAAPQFHENHVLTGTFAFNLLMGRDWPPRLEDFQEAEHLCQELGLEEVLNRMPAGLLQTVGETGWQLSHGERSRLYIARALLQHVELVLLDESFASLDPENLRRALDCVLRRAPTLLVIAHP